jgi:hypothetical protein
MNQEKINTVARFQPEYKNLWLISKRPLSSGYINYIICPEEKVIPSFEGRNYRDIIVDIQKFEIPVIKALGSFNSNAPNLLWLHVII